MRYRNFDLEGFGYVAADEGARFRVRVLDCPAGQQRLQDAAHVGLPPDFRRRLLLLEERQLRMPDIIRLGEELGKALFPPQVRGLFDSSVMALGDDEGLRIRLRLDSYALADLPWEYAFLPDPDTPAGEQGTNGFLALNRRFSVVRFEPLGRSLPRFDPVGTRRIRLVALLSSPEDSKYPPLDLDADERALQEVFGVIPDFALEIYHHATLTTLEGALAQPADVFHFSGHGEFRVDVEAVYRTVKGTGFILLEDDSRRALPLQAEQLARNLTMRTVRLAVLGACEGGRRGGRNAWSGVVPALTHAGIPAVVGMQYSIGDSNAAAFSRGLYTALKEGEWVDAAVTAGRLAILNRADVDERDWGVPVLYLRADAGVLFPKTPAELLLDRLKKALPALISAVALSLAGVAHFLNRTPHGASTTVFWGFSVLFFLALISLVAIAVGRKRPAESRPGTPPRGRSVNRLPIRVTAGLLVLALLAGYPLLTVQYHIPSMSPILAREGAETRAQHPLIRTLPGHSLLGLQFLQPANFVYLGLLFRPDEDDPLTPAINSVSIYNRSTVRSPALELRLNLEGAESPLAAVFAAAVASPPAQPWSRIAGALSRSRGTSGWVPHLVTCSDTPEDGWCYVNPPSDSRSTWTRPTIRLSPIPPRSGVEVFLEFVLYAAAHSPSFRAELSVRHVGEGKPFAVGGQPFDIVLSGGKVGGAP